MDVNLYVIEDYRKKDDFIVRKNKPNSNPISAKPKMSANAFSQKDYENKLDRTLGENKPNSNPIKPNCRKGKIDAKYVFTKDYEENAAKGPKKTNPIQTQFRRGQSPIYPHFGNFLL